MIIFTANGRCAKIKADEPITTGSVGMPVSVVLSGDFDGLAATMVFACGDVSADVALMGQEVTVPPQVLEEAGRVLEIGVYGARADGTIVIPTVWAKAGIVHEGVLPSGVDPAEPTPSWVAQVQQWAEDAHNTAEQLAQDVENWEAEIDAAIENARDATQDATQTAASIAQAESSRVTAEQARSTAESARVEAESARVTAEASRVTAEQSRTAAESSRAEAEQARATAESERATAESARATAEQGRATAEQSRATAETARASAESVRVTAEQGRASAENARASAESARVTAESARASAETSRANAETARSNAESARASEWATIKAEAEDATSAAESAASDATAAAAEARAASAATWLAGNVLFGELAEGTVLTTDDAYAAPPKDVEVYGVSTQAGTPTPDAPQEIKSVDDLTLVIHGVNMLNIARSTIISHVDDTQQTAQRDFTEDQVWLSLATNNYFNNGAVPTEYQFTDTTVSYTSKTASGYGIGFPCRCLPNTKYCLKCSNSSAFDTSDQFMGIGFYDANGNYINYTSNISEGMVTTPSNCRWLTVIMIGQTIGTAYTFTKPQLEAGTVATPYAPYVGQSISIPLSNHIARSLPDGTRDTLTLTYIGPSTEHEGWGVYSKTLEQRVWEVDLGTLTWGYVANTTYPRFTTSLTNQIYPGPAAVANALCTAYVAISQNDGYSGAKSMGFCINSNGIWLWDQSYTDAAAFKTAMSGTKLIYPLATPVTHDLGTVELPILPNPLTTWADGGSAQPTMQLEYEQDINIVIARLKDAIADMATS